MTHDDVLIHIEQPNTPEVVALLRERDDYFDALYAREPRVPNPIDIGRNDLLFFAIRVTGSLAGCGALIVHSEYGELKRFYMRPSFRGRGLARRLLQTVESEAVVRGCSTLRLETGILQPEAVKLYETNGYARRSHFGSYTANPLSIFMEKFLSDTPAESS